MTRKFRLVTRKQTRCLKVSIPLSIYLNEKTSKIQNIQEKVIATGLPTGWIQQPTNDNTLLWFTHPVSSSLINVQINESLNVTIKVDGHKQTGESLSGISRSIESVSDLFQILSDISKLHICKGNTIEEFASVIDEETPKGMRMGKYIRILKS